MATARSRWVERVDAESLEPIGRSRDLAGGPTWPGGVGVHANGSLYTVFGRYAHRLSAALDVVAQCELPRERPYNSFVVLPDGHLVTKDFAGRLPGGAGPAVIGPSELVVLEPDELRVVARCDLPEGSIARLSAAGDDVYAVGESSLFRLRWDGSILALDERFRPRYRIHEGQTYGWDAVITDTAAWFLDDGAGAEGYAGTFRGHGVSTDPLHLVRVDLASGAVDLTEICGLPGGIVANPPVIDESRGIAVGYDSGNGALVRVRPRRRSGQRAALEPRAEPRLSPDPVCRYRRARHRRPRLRPDDGADRRARHRDRRGARPSRYR